MKKKVFFHQNFSTNQISRKNRDEFSDLLFIGIVRWVNTDAEKIPLTFVVFTKSVRKNFFSIKIFRPIRFREKMKLNYSIFFSVESRVQRAKIDAEKILFAFVVFTKSKFFFKKNFSTNQNSRKIQIQFFHFFTIGIDERANSDAEKILLSVVVFTKSVGKNFFYEKFFDQSDFEKKSISIIGPIAHSNRERSRYWCCKNSIVLCCILQIGGKKIIFNLNFSTNQDSRKNQIELWDLLLIGIDGGANTDPVNVVFTFVLSSKSVTKRFFLYKNFSINQNSRKNQIELWDLLLIGIDGGANTDPVNVVFNFVLSSKSVTKRFLCIKIFRSIKIREKTNSIIPLLYHWNRRTSEQWCWKNSIDLCCIHEIRGKKFFYYKNFSTNQNSRKNQIELWDLLLIGIDGGANTDPVNVVFTFVLSSKSVTKRFFCIKIFRPIRIREKTNSIISLLYHWNRRTSEQWCWKNSIDFCCIHEIREKKFFYYKNFSTNQNSRKNQIELWDLLLIGIDGGANTDPVNVVFTFVLSSKSVAKRFFCIKIFRPIRIREKMKFNSSTFSPLESTDEWTLMLKKFYWPFLYSWNRGEKIFFVIKISRPIRIREKIKLNYWIFLSLESRDESTLMLRKFY